MNWRHITTPLGAWEADRELRGEPDLEAAKLAAAPTLTLRDCRTLALSDDLELRGREVWHRSSEVDETVPMRRAGVLAPSVTEERFWAMLVETYTR